MFENVRDRVRSAEADYIQSKRDAKGIRAVVKAIEKMRSMQKSLARDGENTEDLDRLVETSERKFTNALRSIEECLSPSQNLLDFKQWASELRNALRFHDPLMLSMDFADEDTDDDVAVDHDPKSWAAISSSKLVKMTPLGKKGDDTISYLEDSQKRKMQQFRSIAFCAWMFAMLMLVLALAFLTKEFIQSQRHPAISIENIPSKELALPVISICSPHQGVPAFADYPTKEYPGYPLFVITHAENEHDDTTPSASFPDSSRAPWVQPSFLRGDADKCKHDLSSMSIDRSRQSLFRFKLDKDPEVIGVQELDEDPCQTCFSMGKLKTQVVSSAKAHSPARMPLSINVAMSRMYGYCVYKHTSTHADYVQETFEAELIKYYPVLLERGILDMGEVKVQRERESLFSRSSQSDVYGLENMICSVYFFSGFFYPSDDAGKISFKWEPDATKEGLGRWVSTGSRSYSRASHDVDEPFNTGPGSKSSPRDSYFSKSLELYYEDASRVAESNHQVNANSPATILRHATDSFVYLQRKEDKDGSFEYVARASVVDSQPANPADRFLNWQIGFSYREFATTTVSVQPTMSWPEFVTDCFEFVGLFTGVCIFSMIVAPSQALV